MTINKTQENDKLIIAVTGRLDTNTAPKLQETLLAALKEAEDIKLDFVKLNYISSAGLRVLLMGQKTAKAGNGSMTVVNVSDEIMEVFDMTGFSDVLTTE